MNQLDLRMGRAIPVGRGKTMLNFDIYNVLNANAVLTENPAYGRFRQPIKRAAGLASAKSACNSIFEMGSPHPLLRRRR